MQELELFCAEAKSSRNESEIEFIDFFCGKKLNNNQFFTLKSRRIFLYKSVSKLMVSYNDISSDLEQAGYTKKQIADINKKVDDFINLRKTIQIQEQLQSHLIENLKYLVNTMNELSVFFKEINNDNDDFEHICYFFEESKKDKKFLFNNTKYKRFCESTNMLIKAYMNIANEIDGYEFEQKKMKFTKDRLNFYLNLRTKLVSIKSCSYFEDLCFNRHIFKDLLPHSDTQYV